MKKRRLIYIFVMTLAIVLLGLAAVACGNDGGYNRKHEFDNINANAVLHIERTRLTFTKDMKIDDAKIIEECEVMLIDPDTGRQLDVIAADLENGSVAYEKFDLTTAGRDKRIRLSFKNAENYIFYNVIDFKVNFYRDREMTDLWRTITPSSSLDAKDGLRLSVWIDTAANNYATDETARAADPDRAARFNGWYDSSDAAVTGLYVLSVPTVGTERVINLYADFMPQEQTAGIVLEYDGLGRLVFRGYNGEQTDSLILPEGVTYIDMQSVFDGVSKDDPIAFKSLYIPSAARLDVPFTAGYNTSGLEAVVVDEGNPYYASYNGALYSKNYETLYFMPAFCNNTEFHEMLTEFGSYSCAYWQVKTFSLPESVSTLQNYCFAYSALTSVGGLNGVSIKNGVFIGTDVNSYEDGVALYTELSNEGGVKQYGLSMILDKSITEYSVIDGTVDIAGDAFNGCDKLVSVDLGNSVRSIGGSAFAGCKALKEIKLPSTLKTLGSSVFFECESLEKVEGLTDVTFVDDKESYEHTLSTRTFYGCKSLSEITLPEGVVTIAPSAFYGCSNLTSIALPSTLKNIGTASFRASGLTSVEFPIGLETFGSQAFMECADLLTTNLDKCVNLKTLARYLFRQSGVVNIVLPPQITSVPEYCFNLMSNLTSINLVNAEELDNYAIAQNKNLSIVNFGTKLEKIGTRAFSSCTALNEIVLPDSVRTIGGYAFASCSSLTKITIGKGVKTIGVYPFDDDGVSFGATTAVVFYTCNALREIAVADGNTEFVSIDGALYGKTAGGKDFGDAGVLYAVPSDYQGAKFTLPNSVRVILPYAVSNMQNVTEIELNYGLQNIGKAAFYQSKKLTSLVLPSTVANIGASILLNCTAITNFEIATENEKYTTDGNLVYDGNRVVMYLSIAPSVRIREGIVAIDDGVFMNNTEITSIEIPDSVTTVGDKAFSGCTKLASVKIGAGLRTIAPDTFANLPSLASITVSDSNPYFKAHNNILYTKDGKKVVLVAAQNGMTSVELSTGVTEIGEYAFAYHATLSSVVLPNGVKYVDDFAFYECRKVEYFYASETLETIGVSAFSFATSIDPDNKQETRHCNTLKRVLLYGNMKSIGDNAFFGQYGIEFVFFKMTPTQTVKLLSNSGKNYIYLTRGCTKGAGYYNEVTRCLYTSSEPTIDYDGYSWFYMGDDGEPHIYTR